MHRIIPLLLLAACSTGDEDNLLSCESVADCPATYAACVDNVCLRRHELADGFFDPDLEVEDAMVDAELDLAVDAAPEPVEDAAIELDAVLDARPDAEPDAPIDEAVDVALDAAPDRLLDAEAIADAAADLVQDVAPDPDAQPDAAPDQAIDAAPDAAPDQAIDAAPDAAPDQALDAAPDQAVDAAPDAAPDGPFACMDDECPDGLNCVGAACSCVAQVQGEAVLRVDGSVLYPGVQNTLVSVAETGEVLTGVTEVYVGRRHGCGRRDDGTVWCWPTEALGNRSGQLGRGVFDGDLVDYGAAPVLIEADGEPAPLDQVLHVNQGSSGCVGSANCAVRMDGTLWCWGAPHDGGGGGNLFTDGMEVAHPYATLIEAAEGVPLDGVDAVSVGNRHACVLRGGQAWCWGGNIGGPLGQGDQNRRQYPIAVILPGDAQQIGTGQDVTCARVGDRVFCWGSNNSGQVGIGPPAENTDGCINFCRTTPAEVIDGAGDPLTGVTDLNVAYLGICATREDHSLWCWGAQVSDVAAPLLVGGEPLQNVALHTSCSPSPIDRAVIYLTRDDDLRSAVNAIDNECP